MKKRKLALYLPEKDPEKPRDHITNPGILNAKWKERVTERIKEEYKRWEITEDINFRDFTIVNNKIFHKDKPFNADSYAWYSHLDISKDSYDLYALKHLARSCITIKNPFGEEIGLDKYLAHEVLRAHNLKVADFSFISSRNTEFAQGLIKKWKRLVIKPRLGNYGVGVLMIKEYPTIRDVFGVLKESMGKLEVPLLVEKFYPNDIKHWTSVVVFGNKVVYGYRKKIHKFSEGWKVFDDNKIQGNPATVDYVNPPNELKKISIKAATIIEADIIGFDFIKTKQGYKIIDENTKPGLYENCFKEAGINIEDAFINVLKRKIKP